MKTRGNVKIQGYFVIYYPTNPKLPEPKGIHVIPYVENDWKFHERTFNVLFVSSPEIVLLGKILYASERRRELQKKGSRNPATGGDTSLTMQYEFSGMSEKGILYGNRFEEYIPFADAPAYEVVYPMEAKIFAGVAVALVVGAACGVLAFFAAPTAVVVAGVTITATAIAVTVGVITAAAGIATTAYTALQDDGDTAIGEYIHNSYVASAEVGGALVTLVGAPSAAKHMFSKAVPYGLLEVPIMEGVTVSATIIENLINMGVYGVASLKTFFKLNDMRMFFMGEKELGAATGIEWYDELNEIIDILSWKIYFWAATNPQRGELVLSYEGGSGTALAQYGDDFGKIGTYVQNPNIEVDWTQVTAHGAERLQQRGMTQEMVNSIVENGKVLSQNNGSKFAFITKDGVAIVSKEGNLITAWSSNDFDSNMLEIIKRLFGE